MLDGPNLYFPLAAVKLTLDVRALLDLDESDARALARQVGVTDARLVDRGRRRRGGHLSGRTDLQRTRPVRVAA